MYSYFCSARLDKKNEFLIHSETEQHFLMISQFLAHFFFHFDHVQTFFHENIN